MSFRNFLKCGLALSVLSIASGVQAQDSESADEPDIIVVTGSNIAGASDSGAIAVSTLSAEDLEALGQVSAGELFENLVRLPR